MAADAARGIDAGAGDLTSRHAFTLPTVFRAFISFQGAQYGEASALAMVSLIHSILIGTLVQRHLVRGLTLGAVRGCNMHAVRNADERLQSSDRR